MENPIPLVTHQDKECDSNKDYDDYNKPNNSRADKITFKMPDTTDKVTASALRLKPKVKQDKLGAFYRLLNVKSNLDLINGSTVFEFYNGDKWVSLTSTDRQVDK